MKPGLGEPWLPLEKIEEIVQLEPALVIIGLSLGAWLGYRLLLREVSEHRHLNLRRHFRNLAGHLTLAMTLFVCFYGAHWLDATQPAVQRLLSYLGFLTLLSGLTVFVKISRILVFEYLFLSHMRVAVPLLLVNLCTLLMSIGLAAWVATFLFDVKLAPILATSAIFSLVLGLALQDTLGNLFAGVALQMDKPYEIEDWIEISSEGQKWVGQVREISWRATVLLAITDEAITVPNRVMAQSKIANFSTRHHPIARSQVYRVPHSTDLERAKRALVAAAREVPRIHSSPAPDVFVAETTESWITLKLVYFIDDYGAQFSIGDLVNTAAIRSLRAASIELASARMTVLKEGA